MAKRGRQEGPKGPKMSITTDLRARVKAARDAAKLTQRELADLIGTTAATISNVETGRHPQITRAVFDGLQRRLGLTATDADERYTWVMEMFPQLDEVGQIAVESVIRKLLAPDVKPA